jgi:cell division protein FtsX
LIQKLGWPPAIAVALGSLAGALNTIYSSVAARATEIATLRAIGFGGFSTCVGTLVESLILASIGSVLGAAATHLVFDGFTASTVGGNFGQAVSSFRLSPRLIGHGLLLALVVGLLGGLFPALRAARSDKCFYCSVPMGRPCWSIQLVMVQTAVRTTTGVDSKSAETVALVRAGGAIRPSLALR